MVRNVRFLTLAGVIMLAPAFAQERSAGGPMDTQMTWSTLSTKVDSANIKTDALNSRIDQLVVCGKLGKLYAPGADGADVNGCKAAVMPDPASLDISTNTQVICQRGGNHTVVASCPGGQRLLGCGGGPGDMDSSHEYWVLMPDFQNNRCVGNVGNPACYDNGWSRTMVTAICYKP